MLYEKHNAKQKLVYEIYWQEKQHLFAVFSAQVICFLELGFGENIYNVRFVFLQHFLSRTLGLWEHMHIQIGRAHV